MFMCKKKNMKQNVFYTKMKSNVLQDCIGRNPPGSGLVEVCNYSTASRITDFVEKPSVKRLWKKHC